MDKKWLAVFGICLASICVPLDFTIVYTVLPSIQESLKASLLQIQWIMNAYGLCMAVFLASIGRIADIFGRRKIYFIGVFGFCLYALLASLAPSASWLVAYRFICGIAGAVVLGVSQSLITHIFPKNESGKALGIWTAVNGMGMALGVILGGVLVTHLGWRWIFLINVPITAIALVIMVFTVEESRNEKAARKIDMKGLFLLLISITSLMIGIIQGPEWGWGSVSIILFFVISILTFLLFYFIEKKTDTPLIEFHLFQNRSFFMAFVAESLLIFFTWGALFVIPLYLQRFRSFTPEELGFSMLFVFAPIALLSKSVGNLVDKIGSKNIMLFGLILLLLSSGFQIFFHPLTSIAYIFAALLLFGLGWTCIMGPATSLGLSSLPKEMLGVAAGSWLTLQEISGSLGLGIAGTIVRSHADFLIGYHRFFILEMVLLVIGITIVALFKKPFQKLK